MSRCRHCPMRERCKDRHDLRDQCCEAFRQSDDDDERHMKQLFKKKGKAMNKVIKAIRSDEGGWPALVFVLMITLFVLSGCVGNTYNYKTATGYSESKSGDATTSASAENLTEGGVQANAKANAVENLGVNK